jgi:hypothetical protein
MEKVIIRVNPYKLSATIEVVDQREGPLGSGRFATDKAGFDATPHYVSRWSNREWAVEGGLGVGRPLSQRLLEIGERVVDVPAKLAARTRILDSGHGRKTTRTTRTPWEVQHLLEYQPLRLQIIGDCDAHAG